MAATDLVEAKKLAALVRALNQTGHSPATSGNYSLRSSAHPGYALVSESGIDKGLFTEKNLLPVSVAAGGYHPAFRAGGRKPSDEAAVHLQAYRSTSANCVLHSHCLDSLLFADLFPTRKRVEVSGLELLKGFRGIKTHEATVSIPCFDNTQDMRELSGRLAAALNGESEIHGFLLRRHGLYAWGQSVTEAKRHLEVFEYLFKYHLRSRGTP
jgi:methylthioribulose-1-phosphate dehydratase